MGWGPRDFLCRTSTVSEAVFKSARVMTRLPSDEAAVCIAKSQLARLKLCCTAEAECRAGVLVQRTRDTPTQLAGRFLSNERTNEFSALKNTPL